MKAIHVNGFYVSTGNPKVKFPIINLGSGTDCPSRKWCPFDRDNIDKSGRKLCYAQKAERVWTSTLKARRKNAELIATGKVSPVEIAKAISAHFAKCGAPYGRIVRLNESGDLCPENIEWAVALIKALGHERIKTYLYTKAKEIFRAMAIQAGAMVLHSERDFVAVKDAKDTTLPMCPGICGPCKRCPLGKQTAILEH